MNEILFNLSNIFYFMLIFFLIIFLFGIIIKVGMRKLDFGRENIKLYGIFLGLDNRSIVSISLLTVNYILIFYLLFMKKDISYIYLVMLLFINLTFSIINKKVLGIIFTILSSVFTYCLIYFIRIFSDYINEVESLWYVNLIKILLIIFVIIYSTYLFINNFQSVIEKNKYIERRKNESK